MIIGELHHDMMAMTGPQHIISPHEPNNFFKEYSFSEYSQSGTGLYDSDEVHSQPMSFTYDTFYFQFDYQDPIRIWLENSFAERYPFHSILHILNYVIGMFDDLILPIFHDCVILVSCI